MIALIYAWRLLSGQITPNDVPKPLRETAMRWANELGENIAD